MQGRFSGRLETKEDERRLADECKLLGPLLSDSTAGDRALQTLAKIVRGIASGEVRQHVEARERELQVRGRLAGGLKSGAGACFRVAKSSGGAVRGVSGASFACCGWRLRCLGGRRQQASPPSVQAEPAA